MPYCCLNCSNFCLIIVLTFFNTVHVHMFYDIFDDKCVVNTCCVLESLCF